MVRLEETPADELGGLLRQWSDSCLARLGALERPVAAAARTGSLLRPPATESAVAAAERRLGVCFPPSYRQFLLISDGAYGDTMGALTAGGSVADDSDDAWGFLPVAEVRPYVEVDPHAVEIWQELQDEIDATDGGVDLTPVFEGDEVRDHRPMEEALAMRVASTPTVRCWSRSAGLVPARSGRSGNTTRRAPHGGLRRAYLHDTVEEHLGVDELEALLLVAGAESGDQSAVQRLARVRSSEAATILVEAARRGVAPHAVTRALARIGGPEARDHLAAVGAYRQLAELGDPRAPAIAASRLRHGDVSEVVAAAGLLGQLPDSAWVPDLVAAYERLPFDGARHAILHALDACGAAEEVRRRAPDLLDGPYGYLARALLERLPPPENPTQSSRS